jgi:hypothetical protein
MKKNLPTIILLILIVGSSALLVYLFQSFGLGLFLKAIGIFMLLAGIFVFIFFLSIDPGYGWSKTVNFNAHYIAISAAVIICIAGVLLFYLGREIHVSAIQEESQKTRCQKMLDGQVEEVVGRKWYFLSDKQDDDDLSLYLFQRRGETEKYKIIAVDSARDNADQVQEMIVSSAVSKNPVVLKAKGDTCVGIFEENINTSKPDNLPVGSSVEFNVLVKFSKNETSQKNVQKQVQLHSEYCLR